MSPKKDYNSVLLRGGFCAVWMFAFILGITNMISALVEADTQVAAKMTFHGFVFFVVFFVAAITHAHLIMRKKDEA